MPVALRNRVDKKMISFLKQSKFGSGRRCSEKEEKRKNILVFLENWIIQPIKDFMLSFDLTGKLLVSIFFNLLFNTADVGTDVYQAIKHYL